MKTIKLARKWSYVSPGRTIDYPAGEHEVSDEIAEAAADAGVIEGEKAHGGRTTTARTPRAADAAEE